MKPYVKFLIVFCLLILLLFNLGKDVFPCDTWVALASSTAGRITLFAKNSDRLLFDSQPLLLHLRAKWPAGALVDLGRMTIPQVLETFATLGSSPYWCWGYEEGINEFGVAIGNEGVFTKPLAENMEAARSGRPAASAPSGMDLVRLGLERGKTARQALEVITTLIEKYGQFGSAMPTLSIDGAYDNSFIIADPQEAWVLETAGRNWIARKFTQGTTSISNKLSLTTSWDLASSGLVDLALAKGWWPKEKAREFDFTASYIDDSPLNKERIANSLARQTCSARLLREMEGRITVEGMMRIARDRSSTPSIDLDQTASSCIAVLPSLSNDLPVFWWCATTPSSSCYIPFFVHGNRIPNILSAAGTFGRRIIAPEKAERDAFSENSYWWLFRDLCDKINAESVSRKAAARAEFDALEKEFAAGIPDVVSKAVGLRKAGQHEEASKILDAYSESCVAKVLEKLQDLRSKFVAPASALVPEKYKPYVGTYAADSGPLRGREFKVLVRNEHLALDIPGRMVAELREPDEQGKWIFVLTNDMAISFDTTADNKVTGLKLYQATLFPRTPSPELEKDPNAPAELAPYLGKYALVAAGMEITVRQQNGRLVLDIRGQGTLELKPPDTGGLWAFSDDPDAALSFVRSTEAKISGLKIHRVFKIPRLEEVPQINSL